MDKRTLIKYVVAFTYGDGSLIKHGKYSRFEANNLSINDDYNKWRAGILRNITSVTLREVPSRGNRKPITNTRTSTHPIFEKVRSRIYLNGTKRIDPHYLKLFDWETLSIVYMDDGSLRDVTQNYKGNTYHNYYPNIATCNYSYGDNLLLKKAIKENLGVEFNINKHSKNKFGEQTYILVLCSSSREKFINNIEQCVLPSFKYKIRTQNPEKVMI